MRTDEISFSVESFPYTMKVLFLLVLWSLPVKVRSVYGVSEDLLEELLVHEGIHHDATSEIERPDVFGDRGARMPCSENGVVAAWCDGFVRPGLECGILPYFDEYGCTCLGDSALCPEDCVGGGAPVERTHYGIRCVGIPQDEPNYILREDHRALHRCGDNAVVAAWCDESINPHLTCHLRTGSDSYSCACGGRASACPTECIDGQPPIEVTSSLIRCEGIPVDSPNYILKEQ